LSISKDQIEIKDNEPLVLSGATIPNGVVTLYIFSEPSKAIITADNSGKWAYAINELPDGQHHVEAEVTDPSTGQTSTRTKLFAFTINPNSSNRKTLVSAQSAWLSTAFGFIATIGIAFLIYQTVLVRVFK
jgi:hypothetical protein